MRSKQDSLSSIFLTFLRFGFLAWGGPVAQIAMIKEELVDQKNWISQEKFKRTLAIYQALPGPEAHELCVYFGMIKKGRLGGFLAGLGFMLPGFLMMLLLSYIYTLYGAATLLLLFSGIIPAVSALIVRAAHRISSHILTDTPLIIIGIFSAIMSFVKIHFVLIFLIAIFWRHLWFKRNNSFSRFITCLISLLFIFLAFIISTNPLIPTWQLFTSNSGLFLEGLKAGLLSFGGAYTAIPFLHDSMINNYESITKTSFLDGIALASIIPAPLVIFGTYLGFLAGSFSGAFLITLGIFLPAFSFTLVGHKYLERLIENKYLNNILDSISAAVAGILIFTAVQIFLSTIKTPLQLGIFSLALLGFYFIKSRLTIPLMILICGIFGYLLT